MQVQDRLRPERTRRATAPAQQPITPVRDGDCTGVDGLRAARGCVNSLLISLTIPTIVFVLIKVL